MLMPILARNVRRVTSSCSHWLVPAAGVLLMLLVLALTRGATGQTSCTVTYNCQGSSGCASVMGGQVTQRTLSYPNQGACTAAASAASAGRLPVISCNCSGGTSANGT